MKKKKKERETLLYVGRERLNRIDCCLAGWYREKIIKNKGNLLLRLVGREKDAL